MREDESSRGDSLSKARHDAVAVARRIATRSESLKLRASTRGCFYSLADRAEPAMKLNPVAPGVLEPNPALAASRIFSILFVHLSRRLAEPSLAEERRGTGRARGFKHSRRTESSTPWLP